MSLLSKLKSGVEYLPASIGQPLAHVPFGFRLGPAYLKAKRSIAISEHADVSVLSAARLKNLTALLKFAAKEVELYRDFYRSKGFTPDEVRTWADWVKVPVVTKADLQHAPLKARTARGAKGMKVNTGGTSGQPLAFHLDGRAFAREWAHMHHLWKAHGYQPQHLKLTFRGKHFDHQQVLRYNAVHNEYVVNANAPMAQVVKAVLALPRATTIRWLHGYPSLIAEFAHALGSQPAEARANFRSLLYGVLLGSEFPAPVYRTVIEEVLSTNIVSWYGHSEMALLARETARGVYESFPTYGYAEALESRQQGVCRLICTSLHNRVHPFIRYDTGDLVEPVSTHGGSLAFRISEGRTGDFIHDRSGQRHSLTAVIFGRHHRAFDHLQHLQVREDAPGRVALVLTPRDQNPDLNALLAGFDLSDLDIDWTVELVDAPVRTALGKIRLKIS